MCKHFFIFAFDQQFKEPSMIPTSFSAQDFNKMQEPGDLNKQCP